MQKKNQKMLRSLVVLKRLSVLFFVLSLSLWVTKLFLREESAKCQVLTPEVENSENGVDQAKGLIIAQ